MLVYEIHVVKCVKCGRTFNIYKTGKQRPGRYLTSNGCDNCMGTAMNPTTTVVLKQGGP